MNSFVAVAETSYQFERMWPNLPQPWYFNTMSLAVDPESDNFVELRVSSFDAQNIRYFSQDGNLVKQSSLKQLLNIEAAGTFAAIDFILSKNDKLYFVVSNADFSVTSLYSVSKGVVEKLFDFKVPLTDQDFSNTKAFNISDDAFFYTVHDNEGDIHQVIVNKLDMTGSVTKNVTLVGVSPTSNPVNYGSMEVTTQDKLLVNADARLYQLDLHLVTEKTYSLPATDGDIITGFAFEFPSVAQNIEDATLHVTSLTGVLSAYSITGDILTLERAITTSDGLRSPVLDSKKNLLVKTEGVVNIFNSSYGNIGRFAQRGSIRNGFDGFVGQLQYMDTNGDKIYVIDSAFSVVKIFDRNGAFLSYFELDAGDDSRFFYDIKVTDEHIFVLTLNNWVDVYDKSGNYLQFWYVTPNVTVADMTKPKLLKTPAGQVYLFDKDNIYDFINTANGSNINDTGLVTHSYAGTRKLLTSALDASNNLLLVTRVEENLDFKFYLEKYTPEGELVFDKQITLPFEGLGEPLSSDLYVNNFIRPTLNTDQLNNIYLSLYANVQVFDETGSNPNIIASFGDGPGASGLGTFIGLPIAITDTGDLTLMDFYHNRLQTYKKVTELSNAKAIIIAGGGPYTGNSLWNATLMNGNFAYRTLQGQGYSKDRIKYFAEDNFDLDGNGALDDFAGFPTKANIQAALETWASDADNVVIYLVDHGGVNNFRLSETSTLDVNELNTWLSTLEGNMSGGLTLVYDACKSGSFIDELQGEKRTIVSSSTAEENAYFLSQGAVSFSSFFWQNAFNGQSIGDSFSQARSTILANDSVPQTPQISVNGVLLSDDLSSVASQYIGNGTEYAQNVPVITSVSAPQNINDVTSAALTATGITDDDGVARVWGVIWPPNYVPPAGVAPVLDLPTVNFTKTSGTDNYTATYTDFTQAGEYKIAIFARDALGNTSPSKMTSVTVDSALSRKVVIIGGGIDGESSTEKVEGLTKQAYEALIRQGYDDNSIYFIAPTSASVGNDGLNSLSNVEYALTNWASEQSSDVFVYLVGESNGEGSLQLTGDDSAVTDDDWLTKTQLTTWLNTLQSSVTGTVSILADMSNAGQLIGSLQSDSEINRIVMSSTSLDQSALWSSSNMPSFSKYFWSQVTSGSSIRDAFVYAKKAVDFPVFKQAPQLDDNHNGVANEKRDGRYARTRWVGMGILTAGDEPVIKEYSGSATDNVVTVSDSAAHTLYVNNIVSTSELTNVSAHILGPNNLTSTVTLTHTEGNNFAALVDDFIYAGQYQVTFEAQNVDGYFATPVSILVEREIAAGEGDGFETDNSPDTASVLEIDAQTINRHTLHEESDEDWYVFYLGTDAQGNFAYELRLENVGLGIDPQIEFYAEDGSTLLKTVDDGLEGEGEMMSVPVSTPGIYYAKVRVSPLAENAFDDSNSSYDIVLASTGAGFNGTVKGKVVDAETGSALSRVRILTSDGGGALTLPNGLFFFGHPNGDTQITFSLEGYDDYVQDITVKELQNIIVSPSMVATVASVNNAPVFTSIGVTASLQGALYSYTITASDADGDNLTYNAINLPGWLNLNGNVLSGTPIDSDVGSHAVTLSVTDGQDSANQSFTIVVEAAPVVNTAPVFTSTAITTSMESEFYSYTITASDADGDNLTYSAISLPGWLSLNGNVLSGTPSANDVGSHAVTLSVTDGQDSANQSFAIVVEAAPIVNSAPVFTSTAITSSVEGSLYTYALTASDANDDELTFSAVSLPSWLNLNGNVLSGTPIDSDVGSHAVTVSVSDGQDSVSQSFTVTVVDNGIEGLSIEAPADIIIEATGLTTEVALGLAIIEDDKDTNLQGSVDNAGPYAVGEHTITWSVTDSDDNTQTDTQLITVTDTTAPALGDVAEVTVNALGYYSDVSKLMSLTGFDLVDGEVEAMLVGEVNRTPGRHAMQWQVSDAHGNASEVTQSVVILPIARLGGEYLAEVGTQLSIPVSLNGNAVDYPVNLTVDVSATNAAGVSFSLPSIEASISEGQVGSVDVDLTWLEVGDTVELTLGSVTNSVLGTGSASIKLIDHNVAPGLELLGYQGSDLRSTVFKDQGSVMVLAAIVDNNPMDTHSISWDSSLTNTSGVAGQFSFDPAVVDEGSYLVSATVTETNTSEQYSTTVTLSLNVAASTPMLSSNQDSDNDGINDDIEGFGDSDGDGIADYLDDNQDVSQLPIGQFERLQTSPGLMLSIGQSVRQALGVNASMASMSTTDFAALMNKDNSAIGSSSMTPVMDFIISGLTQAGDAATVIIPLPRGLSLPANAEYMKYHINNGWSAFVEEGGNSIASAALTDDGQCPAIGSMDYQSGLLEGTSCIALTLVDGGAYDNDGLANGQIADPAIINSNYAPNVSIDGIAAMDELTTISLTANALDPENAALSYLWEQISGPSAELVNTDS
ncbi:hypothetical protein ND16A_0391, partial [Thalassotalea sp. ND16A]